MAFNKKTWVDRVSDNPTRRVLTPTDVANTYDITRAEGTVHTEGDMLNAQTLNALETRIDEGINGVSTDFTKTAYAVHWTSTPPCANLLTIEGILATDNPIIDIVLSSDLTTAEAVQKAWSKVYRATTANGSITLYASEAPTVDLNIQVKVVR